MAESLTYSIRDLEALSGIPAHTIRTWERRYSLFSPARDAGNARYYDSTDISHLNHLVVLLKQGHRISTLAGKSREEIASMVKESTMLASEGDFTETLCMTLKEFDATNVENLMSCFIRKEGFDKAVSTRFVPLLDQMSFLLLTGILQPVHAQLYYALLSQKVQAAVDAISPSRDGARWVLVHNEDLHETIYRDIMQYLLRKTGKQVIIGGTASQERIQLLVKEARPDGFCLVAGPEPTNEWLQRVLTWIPSNQGNTLVLVPGKTLEIVNNPQMQDVSIMRGLNEAFQRLN